MTHKGFLEQYAAILKAEGQVHFKTDNQGLFEFSLNEFSACAWRLQLRNKDAVLLGYGGPECGDICFWTAEGYNQDHTDSLSTTWGEADTSISPIFIAAGSGLKKSFKTDRIIRQIDLAPTVAALLGVRMPAQCEGAPAYQIFEEELIYN